LSDNALAEYLLFWSFCQNYVGPFMHLYICRYVHTWVKYL
jgi:hypothetical protein